MRKNLLIFIIFALLVSSMSLVTLAADDDDKITLVVLGPALPKKDWFADAVEEYKEMNPNIDFKLITGNEMKFTVSVAGGEQIDIVEIQHPIQLRQYVTSKSILSLDDLASKYNLNFAEYYGQDYEDGKLFEDHYMLPYKKSAWLMLYNKSIFDEAGIPYPEEQMTWEEYMNLAKKLTLGERENKKYGAYNLTWPMYYYAYAIQKLGGGEHFYTEDGFSNIDDPAFKKSLEIVYTMMHEDKSMPEYARIITEKLGWDGFWSGKYAMHMHGNWSLGMLKNTEKRPRDWKAGITYLPVPAEFKGKEHITWGVHNAMAMPRTAKHPEEAFKFMKYMVEEYHQYNEGSISSYIQADMDKYAERAADGLEDDGITPEDIKKYILDPDVKFVTEKITGAAAVEYESIFKKEVELYLVKEQTLEETISNIKEKADKAIKKAKE